MPRITYVLYNYPEISETYVSAELASVPPQFELDVISRGRSTDTVESQRPYVIEKDGARILERTRAFAPDAIHTHWVWGPQLSIACRLAKVLDRPLTVRAHSFDILGSRPRPDDPASSVTKNLDVLCSDLCLGILTMPFGVERLVRAGVPERKLIPCWPVVDYQRFHDETPNGVGVVNVGSCLPKKDFPAYLELARRMPDVPFHLYAVGAQVAALRATNEALGAPVSIHDAVPHGQMPRIFKQYEWLVYTADRTLATVGWPVSVPEAQAAGLGVCMPNLRPDIKDFVGPAGFVYDTLDEVADIIRRPYPPAMREAGFAHARRSDVREHLPLLTAMWAQA